MKIFTYHINVYIIIFISTAYSQTIDLGDKLLPATEQEISDFYFAKDVLGFPYLYQYDGDEKNILIPTRYQLSSAEEIAFQWYKEGLLAENKRGMTISQAIRENDTLSAPLPCEGFLGYEQLGKENQDPNFDSSSLIAAFYIAAKMGEIDDVLPFLRFSRVYTYKAGAGIRSPITSMHDREHLPLPPEDRLTYFPAAYALFSHPQKTIPLLLKVIPDKTISEDLRLRAASFLNTMNPSLIDDRLYQSCDEEINQKLRLIKEDALLWLDTLNAINDKFKEQDKVHWERYKKRWGIPEDVDIIKLNKENRQKEWEFLRTDFDPNQ